MAMRNFYNEVKGKKVKEVWGYVKPMLTTESLKKSAAKGLDNYHAKYIETDSFAPVYHVVLGGMAFSYLVALPEERRHLAHQLEHASSHH